MPFKTPTSMRPPAFRLLKAYAFDPSLSLDLDTTDINRITYPIVWEALGEGPVGEYLEVIDYDPASRQTYPPVNLDHPYLLAQHGLEPSETNLQFHQQMVYAVAMYTIQHFERALGRKIFWCDRHETDSSGSGGFVQRLKLQPHALREPNAFYSSRKKAILFGYFSARPELLSAHMPGALVFTCLSHDIIAHEITHAILDGIHPRFNRPTNPDVLAFHEGFADLIALLQHFTFPEVLKHQIAKTRSDLSSQNLLGKLARELGSAIGPYGSMRGAIGELGSDGQWKPHIPNPQDYQRLLKPHERGGILVAAVFDAFLTIYKRRIADLLRMATNGSGNLPQGELHPDLVNRLAQEASKAARHVLTMCIRALDYCPPIDITFADYLRAIITADLDLLADDQRDYRLAFIDAFRKRGIYPEGARSLSMENLAYPVLNLGEEGAEKSEALEVDATTQELLRLLTGFLREYRAEIIYLKKREDIFNTTKKYIDGWQDSQKYMEGLHSLLKQKINNSVDFSKISNLVLSTDFKRLGIRPAQGFPDVPSFSIEQLRLVSRTGPGGAQINQVIFSIFQESDLEMENGAVAGHLDHETNPTPLPGRSRFSFAGACTLIFDLDTLVLKYAISKPLLNPLLMEDGVYEIDWKRAESQYEHLKENPAKAVEEAAFSFNQLSTRAEDPVELFEELHKISQGKSA